MNRPIDDNATASRFELEIDGQVVFAVYERRPSVLVIKHVEAPPSLRGTGAAGRLMQGVAEIARSEDRRIAALCGYARSWLRQHKSHRDLLV